MVITKKLHCGALHLASQQGIIIVVTVTMTIIAYGLYEGTGAAVRVQLERLYFRLKRVLKLAYNLYVFGSTT